MKIKKRLIITLIASVLVSLFISVAPTAQAQGTLNIYFAISPDYRAASYNPFLSTMTGAMRSLDPVSTFPFIPSGSNLPLERVLTYDDNVSAGGVFLVGMSVNRNTPFTTDQILETVSSPAWSDSHLTQNITFGVAAYGIKWGPNGKGSGDTVYSSGNANGVLLNELYMIPFGYAEGVSAGQTREDVLGGISRLYGQEYPITAQFDLGGLSAHGIVNFQVPEPNTWIISSIGLGILMIMGRHRR